MKCKECETLVLCDGHYELWCDFQLLMRKSLDSNQVALESRTRLEDIIKIDLSNNPDDQKMTPAISILVVGWKEFMDLCMKYTKDDLFEKEEFLGACHKVVKEFDAGLTAEDRNALALHGDKFDLIPLVDSLITPQVEASTMRFYIDAINVFNTE
jgi:hypothetical protein